MHHISRIFVFIFTSFIVHSLIARWFVKRRGMMSGIVKVGTGTGQFVVPFIVTACVAAYGWRNSYLIIGAVILVALVAVAQVMRREPQGMGLLPDDARDEVCGVGNRDPEPDISLRAAALTSQFWIICLSEFATLLCLLTMVVHIVPHGTDMGLPPTNSGGSPLDHWRCEHAGSNRDGRSE